MAIYHGTPPESDFTRVPNSLLRNPKLSAKGKAMVSYLLSHRSGYPLTTEQMVAEFAESKNTVYAMLNETIKAGVVRRVYQRNEQGHVTSVDYLVIGADGKFPQVTSTSQEPGNGELGNGSTCDDAAFPQVTSTSQEPGNGKPGNGKLNTKKTSTKKTKDPEDHSLEDQTPSPYPLNAPHPTSGTSTQEEEGIESNNDNLKTLAEGIALSYRPDITVVEARRLTHHIADALARGWDEQAIRAELGADHTGLASLAAGLIARARTLGTPPEPDADPEDLHPYVPNPDDPGYCMCTLHKDSADHTPPPTGWGTQTTGTQADSMLTGFMAEPSSCPDHPDQSGVNCPECAEERANRSGNVLYDPWAA